MSKERKITGLGDRDHLRRAALRLITDLAIDAFFLWSGWFSLHQFGLAEAAGLFQSAALPLLAAFLVLDGAVELISASRICLSVAKFAIVLGLHQQAMHASIWQRETAARITSSAAWFYILAILVGCLSLLVFRALDDLPCGLLYGVFFAAMTACYITLFLFGTEIHGTRAWLKVGSLTFQLSELARVCLLLAAAAVLANPRLTIRQKAVQLFFLYGVSGVSSIVINELSTWLISALALLLAAALFLRSVRPALVALLSATAVCCLILLLSSAAAERVAAAPETTSAVLRLLANIWNKFDDRLAVLTGAADPLVSGYQSSAAEKALLKANFWGYSPLSVRQYVPVKTSDFSVLNLVGLWGILPVASALLGLSLAWGISLKGLRHMGSPLGAAACLSVSTLILQTTAATWSGCGLSITMGIGLPLIGAGGTSALAMMILLGEVLYSTSVLAERTIEAESALDERSV